jgi:hypothetical protein
MLSLKPKELGLCSIRKVIAWPALIREAPTAGETPLQAYKLTSVLVSVGNNYGNVDHSQPSTAHVAIVRHIGITSRQHLRRSAAGTKDYLLAMLRHAEIAQL